MAAGYRSYDETTSASASGVTITKPSGTISGDLLIAQYRVNRASITITPPAGWTSIRKDEQGTRSSELFYRMAGGSEGASYAFSHSGGAESVVGTIMCFSGCSLTAAVGASNGVGNASGGPSVSTITPAAANNIIVMFVTNENASTAAYALATSSPTFVEVYDTGSSGYKTAAAYGLRSASTATGTATATGDTANITQILALTPADDVTISPSIFAIPVFLQMVPDIIQSVLTVSVSLLTVINDGFTAKGKSSPTWSNTDKS